MRPTNDASDLPRPEVVRVDRACPACYPTAMALKAALQMLLLQEEADAAQGLRIRAFFADPKTRAILERGVIP